MAQSSVDVFRRRLQELYKDFKTDLERVVASLVNESDPVRRTSQIKEMFDSASRLQSHLCDEDRPAWLEQVVAHTRKFLQNPNALHGDQFLHCVLKYYRQIQPIEFDDGVSAIDFDAIYEKYRNEGRIGELFDELIRIVNEIIESGEVDRLTVLETLRQVVSLLQANRNGSFLAISKTVVSVRFLLNLTDEFIAEIPVAKQFRAAYKKTVDDMQSEVTAIDNKVQAEAVSEIARRLPKLTQLPHYKAASATILPPLALPAPEQTDSASPE